MEINYDSWEKFENMWNLGRGSDKDSHDYILWVRHCFQFWFLFPRHYDFYKDDMVLLLEAATDFSADFGSLEEIQIFQFSRIDPSTGKSRYKLNDTIVDLLQEQRDSTYFRLDDIKSSISENTLHASLGDGSNVLSTLKDLCRAEKLRTLLILHEHGSPIYQVPRHLFIKLPFLRVLDLSHTNITDLPSSVGNLKHLKYLNLSRTPITKLPNSVCNLYNLQALKLRGCLKLVRLPKDIRKLKNLQQLDVDVNCLLISMPPGLGDLQKLKALPAFVVGKENGCHITELKHMNICGNFQILRLENISRAEEAMEAKISTKDNIRKLQLQWTELQDGLEILENLRPPIRLQELHIVGYGGVRLPSWLGEYHPYKLVTITISDCRKCESLPSLGNIPFLKFLRISDMHAVKKIDNEFCGQKAFPKLEKLTLNAMPELEKWSGIKIGYFGYLLKLNISNCSKLTYLPNLSCLKSLLELEISLCPLLESFPKEGLPTSLGCIVIIDCPLLKDRCHTNEGPEWGTIAHIANIRIDYQQISHEQETASNQTQNLEQTKSMHYSTITSPMSLPTSDTGGSSVQAPQQLDELIHVEVTEMQPHLEGNKKLKDVEIPKGAADMDSKTQPKAFETSSEDDEGATTGRPVIKEIVELRLEQLYDSLANQSCNKFSSFHAEFDEMMKKLDVMRSFLNQNSTNEEDPTVKIISAAIKEFVYEADDIVLDCQILADYEEVFPRRHDIDIDIKGFRLRIERMLKVADMIERDINRWNKNRDPENQMTLTRNKGIIGSTSARRVSYNGRSHSKAVGLVENVLKGDVQKIKRWIFTNEKSRQIAITGRGGLGKTTIARTIYKDNDVRRYFDQLIWVTVSTPFSKTDILSSFLIQLGYSSMTDIERSLNNKKYLIVMEGVWMMDYDWWRMLLEHLPAERDRRIIITTTNEEIARNMGVTCFHRARNLDENESWSLFCELVFSADQKRNLNSEFETVGKDIVKKCKGILLAIKAVAGLLATKTESPVLEWEIVNSNFRVNNNESIVRTTLELSYDDLPAMLKHCILCFSIYPYDTVIDAEQLIYWWVGEGFVQGDDRKTAIEVAFQCLSQLVSRCLVEVDHYGDYDGRMDMFNHYRGYRGYDGRIYKCRMHDMVRDFIIEKSRIEGFSSSGGEGFYCRHLGYTSKMDKEILGKNPKLRAFISMEDASPLKLETGPDRIKSLRVLDLSLGRLRVDVVNLLSFIKSQKGLAYLNLKGVANLTQVPDWIKKLRNLKVLVLNDLEKLPSSITTLHNLLVLDVMGCNRLKLPPGFGGLTKLQVLRGFRVSKELNDLAELRELKHLAELRELTIILYKINEIGDGEEYFLSQLSKLKVLTIRCVWGALVNRLTPPPSLKELNLESCVTTPHWLTPASLPKLVYLNIHEGGLRGVNPSFWEGNGEGWRIEGLCFNNLRRFKLDWEVVKSNMKYLRYAEVRWCPGLKSFPFDASYSGVWDKEEEMESRLQSMEKTADDGKGKISREASPHQLSSQYGSFAKGKISREASAQ